MPSDPIPVACSLDSGAFAARQSELRASVLAEAAGVERLPNGYRWSFRDATDLFARLGAVIDAERRCCRFLTFALHADADLGMVTVEITGPEGTADLLQPWIAQPRDPGLADHPAAR